MKKVTYLILSLTVMLITMACTTRDWPGASLPEPELEGRGGIDIQLKGSAPTRATTSTITQEEANLFLVTITKGDDIIAQQTQLGNVGHMTFPAGYGYKLFVESITESDAETLNEGWGAKRFTGNSKSFGIQAGQTTAVAVNCTVANAAVAVNMAEGVEGCTVIVTDGSRTLTTTTNKTAWFNVTTTASTTVTVKVEKDGETVSEAPLELQPAQVKDVNLKPTTPSEDTGSVNISITYDDTFIIVPEEIIVEP